MAGITTPWKNNESGLVDSGERTTFETGAQREIVEDKGRCDLLPLDVVEKFFIRNADERASVVSIILRNIDDFRYLRDIDDIIMAIDQFIIHAYDGQIETAILELAKHYEAGSKKYADRNWEKGLPIHSFVDSGVRHLLKWARGDKDEPHDRAFLWNMLGLVWTYNHHPELDDYTIKEVTDE